MFGLTKKSPQTLGDVQKQYTPREMWVKLFDPSSPSELRRDMLLKLRKGVEEECSLYGDVRKYNKFHPVKEELEAMPRDLTLVIIMTGGYSGKDLYGYLKAKKIAERFVLAGFSSGGYTVDKRFSNGKSMNGTIYAPKDDLEIMLQNQKSPILLYDDVIDTGLTVSLIGKALKKKLGHSGELLEMQKIHPPSKWTGMVAEHEFDTAEMRNIIKKWKGKEARIMTEEQREFAALKRDDAKECVEVTA